MIARGLTEASAEPEPSSPAESVPAEPSPSAPDERRQTWSTGPSQPTRTACYAEAKADAKTRPELERNYRQCLSRAAPRPAQARVLSADTRQACLDEARATFDGNAPKAEAQAYYRACLERARGNIAGAFPGSPASGADEEAATPLVTVAAPSAASRHEAFDLNALKGCVIVADDGEFLGLVADRFATQSIMNRYGAYGSEYQAASIFNNYGQYGGEHSALSPFNPYTSTPPRVFRADGTLIAYLTRNRALSPTIDPHFLIGMLRAEE